MPIFQIRTLRAICDAQNFKIDMQPFSTAISKNTKTMDPNETKMGDVATDIDNNLSANNNNNDADNDAIRMY